MTPEQLARRNAALSRANAANARAVNGVLSAADSADFDAAMAEVSAIDADVKAAQSAANRAAALAAASSAPQPRRTVVDGAMDTAPVRQVAAEVRNTPADGGFVTPRAFLSAVMAAGRNELSTTQRNMLQPFAAAGGDEASGFSDSYGGFLIPPAFAPGLLMVEPETDPTAGQTTLLPMTAPIVKIPARTDKNHSTSVTGGLRFYRRAEADAATSSRMQLEQVELKANPLTGLSFATEELLMDSPTSFIAMLESAFGDEYNATLLQEKLFGTGVGQYMGVMNSPCLVTQAKETGQAAATIVYQNILNMRARCWRYSGAVWLANHVTFPQLAQLSLAVGTGGLPVYMPSAQVDRPDMLLGRPIYYTEFCSALGTVGDIVLGNWSQYLEGHYQSPTSAESVHVRFVNNERAFRVTARNDGQPWWRSALTPKNGNSLSPFVTLAAR